MNKITANQRLLKTFLSMVVSEWGYDAVRRCLSELEGPLLERPELNRPDAEGQAQTPLRCSGNYHRPTAVDLVNRLDVPDSKKSLLITLASQFEGKAFLPTVSDVRHFLEMRGQQSTTIKQRQDSFGKVLGSLLSMPEDELERFVQNNSHSGPSQLGPLSAAIKATSAAVRSFETPASISQVGEDSPAPQDQQRGSTEHSSDSLTLRPPE